MIVKDQTGMGPPGRDKTDNKSTRIKNNQAILTESKLTPEEWNKDVNEKIKQTKVERPYPRE